MDPIYPWPPRPGTEKEELYITKQRLCDLEIKEIKLIHSNYFILFLVFSNMITFVALLY